MKLYPFDLARSVIDVQRTRDNQRARPNEHKRHDPFHLQGEGTHGLRFINPTDLEWMSLNYRKHRAAKMSPSKRRIILVMFQDDYQYFPTLREIKNELIAAQIKQIETDAKRWTNRSKLELMKWSYRDRWQLLFQLPELGDLDKPLTPKILSNPTHKITKHILYIYSMESFIYADLNRASREKDKSKIKYYGAFAAALSYIIYFAN